MPISAFSVDSGPALGAGDDNLTLTPGYTADSAAVWAGEILMLLVRAAGPTILDGVHDLSEKPGILPAPLGQIPGEHAKQDPHHQKENHRG